MSSELPPPPKRQRKEKEQSKENATECSPNNNNNSDEKQQKKKPLLVFAHGAGAPSTSEWMIRWKEMLGEALSAVDVVTFDYPYISGGKRRAPPKAEKLVDHHVSVIKDATTRYTGHPLVLVGKSMGSRVSCMVASAEDIHVSAIICLGYPLKGINGVIREETLLKLLVPTMFVQGSKDSLCPLEKLEGTRKKMTCVNELHVVDGGDHSFKIGKKFLQSTGTNQDESERKAVEAIAEFVCRYIQ
ncbi:KAT8 regulatory NSL complex subunit 3 [Iris pallida]|uniref:KAT8 regulatory NSL complex subunit 3 n=1 Tax=Iris pallida TaxID=29817 RepID=A0AAX6FDN3_IRIPA|nr:KAT8 regulatory NSL complex subunit 3 [Iris pallida]